MDREQHTLEVWVFDGSLIPQGHHNYRIAAFTKDLQVFVHVQNE